MTYDFHLIIVDAQIVQDPVRIAGQENATRVFGDAPLLLQDRRLSRLSTGMVQKGSWRADFVESAVAYLDSVLCEREPKHEAGRPSPDNDNGRFRHGFSSIGPVLGSILPKLTRTHSSIEA